MYKENGKIKLLVTNYTNTEKVLKLVTDSGITSVTIPACPLCNDGLAYTTLSDFPFDIEIEVDGNYIVCYDTEISEENQIRYVTFVEDNSITVPELFKQICDAIREKTGTTNLIKHTDIPSMIRSIIINCNEHLSSITATKTKTEYTVNDTFNIDDITVTANYSDGSSSVVSGWTSNVSDVDMASEGWTKDDVQALCDEYGLNCTLEPVETNAYAEGKIISQSRRVGSTISRGSSLTVKYAVKPTKKPAASSSPSTTPSSGTTTTPSASPDDTDNQ